LAIAVQIFTLALSIWAWATIRMNLLGQVFFFGLLLALVTTMACAGYGAYLAGRTVRRQWFALVLLTALPARRIAVGLIAAALYRMRGLVAVYIGLFPGLVLGWLGVVVDFNATWGMFNSYYYGEAPPPPDILGPGIFGVVLALCAWGLPLAGAALGAGLGVQWRAPIASTVVAMLLATIFVPFLWGAYLVLGVIALYLVSWIGSRIGLAVVDVFGLVWLLGAFLLAVRNTWRWGIDRAAYYLRRRDPLEMAGSITTR
jgi:hypothetical protein